MKVHPYIENVNIENVKKKEDSKEEEISEIKDILNILKSCFERYTKIISCLLVVIIIIVIIIIVEINKQDSKDNSCIGYLHSEFASAISINCFRLIWKNNGCKDVIPDNYNGWWLRSPEGGRMVPCIYPKIKNLCGAGNFLVILTHSSNCNLNYEGIN